MNIRITAYLMILAVLCVLLAGPGCDCSLNSYNNDPTVTILADSTAVWPADSLRLYLHATDADDDTLTISWDDNTGSQRFADVAAGTTWWHAPATAGNYFIYVTVADGHGGEASDTLQVLVKSPTGVKVWMVSPTAGSRIVGTGTCPVSVRAWHTNGIAKVEFYCGPSGTLSHTETRNPPYSTDTLVFTYPDMDVDGVEDPAWPILAKAYASTMPAWPGSVSTVISVVGSDVIWKR